MVLKERLPTKTWMTQEDSRRCRQLCATRTGEGKKWEGNDLLAVILRGGLNSLCDLKHTAAEHADRVKMASGRAKEEKAGAHSRGRGSSSGGGGRCFGRHWDELGSMCVVLVGWFVLESAVLPLTRRLKRLFVLLERCSVAQVENGVELGCSKPTCCP